MWGKKAALIRTSPVIKVSEIKLSQIFPSPSRVNYNLETVPEPLGPSYSVSCVLSISGSARYPTLLPKPSPLQAEPEAFGT